MAAFTEMASPPDPPDMANRDGTSLDIEMHPISNVGAGLTSQPSPMNGDQMPRLEDGNMTRSAGSTHDQMQTLWAPYKNRFRVLACCLTALGNGANDSAPGALIASIERYMSTSPPYLF